MFVAVVVADRSTYAAWTLGGNCASTHKARACGAIVAAGITQATRLQPRRIWSTGMGVVCTHGARTDGAIEAADITPTTSLPPGSTSTTIGWGAVLGCRWVGMIIVTLSLPVTAYGTSFLRSIVPAKAVVGAVILRLDRPPTVLAHAGLALQTACFAPPSGAPQGGYVGRCAASCSSPFRGTTGVCGGRRGGRWISD